MSARGDPSRDIAEHRLPNGERRASPRPARLHAGREATSLRKPNDATQLRQRLARARSDPRRRREHRRLSPAPVDRRGAVESGPRMEVRATARLGARRGFRAGSSPLQRDPPRRPPDGQPCHTSERVRRASHDLRASCRARCATRHGATNTGRRAAAREARRRLDRLRRRIRRRHLLPPALVDCRAQCVGAVADAIHGSLPEVQPAPPPLPACACPPRTRARRSADDPIPVYKKGFRGFNGVWPCGGASLRTWADAFCPRHGCRSPTFPTRQVCTETRLPRMEGIGSHLPNMAGIGSSHPRGRTR